VDYLWRSPNHYGFPLLLIGDEWVTSYEILSLVLSAGFVILGTRMRRYSFALSGLVGLAALLFLATNGHFKSYLSWPLALTISGGIAMAIGVVLVVVKARKDPHREI